MALLRRKLRRLRLLIGIRSSAALVLANADIAEYQLCPEDEMRPFSAILASLVLGCQSVFATAQAPDRNHSTTDKPRFNADGTTSVPAFELPFSVFASEQAKDLVRLRTQSPSIPQTRMPRDIAGWRTAIDAMLTLAVKDARNMYAVDVEDAAIAGIHVRIVTPVGGHYDPDRVLINLHGGAFSSCWESCSLLESIPIAALGGYKVVSVNYRMAPEYKHPAALEDAAKVYEELLRHYRARHIGIYGCSAGGALTAQLAAWLPAHGLPQAGAVGIFAAGGVRGRTGDSAYFAAYVDGTSPPPRSDGTPFDNTRGYFDGLDLSASDISPALHQEVLKLFPPALLITSTRAYDLSPSIFTNSQLIKAGVETDLIVADGLHHCYMNMPALPEAREAHAATVAFFKKHLR